MYLLLTLSIEDGAGYGVQYLLPQTQTFPNDLFSLPPLGNFPAQLFVRGRQCKATLLPV
jgi:hypothetical protein